MCQIWTHVLYETAYNRKNLSNIGTEPLTQEEGTLVINNIRMIRDDYLFGSELGRSYINMYVELGPEIISSLASDPQAMADALELILEASYRIENIEYYLANGYPVIDDNFINLANSILDVLTSHTSPEMVIAADFVREDINSMAGLSADELIDYFVIDNP